MFYDSYLKKWWCCCCCCFVDAGYDCTFVVYVANVYQILGYAAGWCWCVHTGDWQRNEPCDPVQAFIYRAHDSLPCAFTRSLHVYTCILSGINRHCNGCHFLSFVFYIDLFNRPIYIHNNGAHRMTFSYLFIYLLWNRLITGQ